MQVLLILMYFDRNMQNMQNNTQNMQICKTDFYPEYALPTLMMDIIHDIEYDIGHHASDDIIACQ